jgi:phytanoyl-CoA hydroxylase
MATPFEGLSPDQVAQYQRDGFLTIPGWFNSDTIGRLRTAASRILDECDPSIVSVFSTDEKHHLARDTYFLESGDKVRCFFEEHAFNPDGSLKKSKQLSINKAGHDLHTKISEFKDVSLCPETAAICRSLGYIHPLVVQVQFRKDAARSA